MGAAAGWRCNNRAAVATLVAVKTCDIFRYGKSGKSLAGVGRWGLVFLLERSFRAPRRPKHPIL